MDLAEYLGRFHPVLVHLPIGILISAILLEGLSLTKRFDTLKAAQILLVLGFISAVLTLTTGFLHKSSGDFSEELTDPHSRFGIAVTFFSLLAIFLHSRKKKAARIAYYVVILILLVLLVLTGHTGGEITHGSDFLSFHRRGPQDRSADDSARVVYAHIVAPIIANKCTRCHGASRQKAHLRLDKPEYIVKGGKNGPILDLATPEQGEMWRRIAARRDDKDHMPPKGKAQLAASELALIKWWLNTGASFTTTTREINGADSVITQLIELDNRTEDVRQTPVAMPDKQVMSWLREKGAIVSFLAEGDGRISVQLRNVDSLSISNVILTVFRLAPNVTELKVTGRRLTPVEWAGLSQLNALERLYVQNSNFSDEDIPALAPLTQLRYLNLVGTSVSVESLTKLSCPLEDLYLYNTRVVDTDVKALRIAFPNAEIVIGNFDVPTLAADTTEIKTAAN